MIYNIQRLKNLRNRIKIFKVSLRIKINIILNSKIENNILPKNKIKMIKWLTKVKIWIMKNRMNKSFKNQSKIWWAYSKMNKLIYNSLIFKINVKIMKK